MGQVQARKPQMGLTFEDVWAMFQETDKKFQETDRKIQETDRIVKENARQMGDLHNRFGELAEHMVAPSIKEKFNELGFHFTETATNKEFDDPENIKGDAEVDIFLENSESVIAVEVKAKPKTSDVDDHIQRMEILRRHADGKHDKRRYRGAIAGAILGKDVRRYILKSGFYLIEQTGDTVQITIPEGFKARDW